MARPRKSILAVTKILAGGTWRLVCGRAPYRVKISVQHLVTPTPDNRGLAELDAERLRLELAAARSRGDWPPWARKLPVVQRLLARQQNDRLNGRGEFVAGQPVVGQPDAATASMAAASTRSSPGMLPATADTTTGTVAGAAAHEGGVSCGTSVGASVGASVNPLGDAKAGALAGTTPGIMPGAVAGKVDRKVDNRAFGGGGAANAGVYDLYAVHLGLSVCASWKASQLAFLRELSATQDVPLLLAAPAHVQDYLVHILRTPGPRDLAAHATAVQRWRRGRLRAGFDPDTGKPLPAGTPRPSGPPAKHGPAEKPAPPPPRSVATRNQGLRALRSFFEWAIRQGFVGQNPTAGLRQMREPPPEEVFVLSHAERTAFLEEAATEPDGLAIAIGLYAGLRRAEIIRADWKHVRLDKRTFRVPRHKRGGEQTPRVRTVPISARLHEALAAVPESRRQGLLIDWSKGMDARRKDAGKLLKRLAARPRLAGMRREKFDWRVLRHTFCTGHLDAGVAPGVVCQWSGHTEKVFWQNYAGYIRDYDARIDLIDRVPAAE